MRIIQFLNWDINSIIGSLDTVAKQNFDTIQINPVQPFIKVDGYEWWATYQPLNFKIGNIYGSKEDLKKLCKAANEKGIKIVVDVITNHLANNGAGQELIPNENIDEYIRNNKGFWKNQTRLCNYQSYIDIITQSIGLPGLNLKNEELENIVLNFLNELKECGVSGFRFDAAKHIGLPSDNVNYFKRVKDFLDKNNLIAYAEFLDGPNDVSDELTKTLYDKKNEFADLMYILTEENSLVNNPNKKVTFVESHDTYLNEGGYTRYEDTKKIINDYANLTQKFPNTLFYVRDRKYGKKMESDNPDRSKDADNSWENSEILREANKNIVKKSNTIEKEVIFNMNEHHNECMEQHRNIVDLIRMDSTVSECINLALTDYNNQVEINKKYGIANKVPFDTFLMDCVMNEIFKNKWYYPALQSIGYERFYIETLMAFKSRFIDQEQNLNEIDHKIRILKKDR